MEAAMDQESLIDARRRASPFLRPPFGRLVLVWLGVGLVLGVVIAASGSLSLRTAPTEAYFFRFQDVPVLVVMLALTALLGLAPLPAFENPAVLTHRRLVLALAAVTLVLGAVGGPILFDGYTLSLDEFLANFDAKILASGRLFATVPQAWRPYVPAMQPMFMLPLPPDAWASSYLPVNAGLRALGRLAHGEGLVNPLLSAFSVVAVWGVARKLWPDRPQLALIAAALLGTSAQLIVMSMTAYAMPAHLAFNLAWLWLFLRGGRAGHAGAIAVGLLATGLHQLIFHPVFVAPFVLQLWLDRRWRLASLYTFAYGLIILFWIEYWPFVMGLAGGAPPDESGGELFIDRVTDALNTVDWSDLGLMAECLVRFVTWQNPLTVPLALWGLIGAFRARGMLRALALGVVLTLVAAMAGSPTQTHGWGYRYLHGLLGSVSLLAAWSWSELTGRLAPDKRAAAARAIVAACAFSLLALVPLRSWQAWRYVSPYAEANAAIQSAKADVVVVDHAGRLVFDAGTVTRNDPFLWRRPKVMALMWMSGPMVRQLCADHTVALFDQTSAAEFRLPLSPWTSPAGPARLRALMTQLKCGDPIRKPAP
jgi:hypothetical protein